jgi:hypothetical protein
MLPPGSSLGLLEPLLGSDQGLFNGGGWPTQAATLAISFGSEVEQFAFSAVWLVFGSRRDVQVL